MNYLPFFHFIKNIFLLLITFSVTAFSQKIEKVEVSDNKVFGDEEIKKWAGLNEGQNYFSGILDSSFSRISSVLSYNGYFNFSFEGSKESQIILYNQEGFSLQFKEGLFSLQ